ncbi:Uncharacterised protein [Vibrio cholerae]|nr:Uncharacterised protein [Vibrio cholerae]
MRNWGCQCLNGRMKISLRCKTMIGRAIFAS